MRRWIRGWFVSCALAALMHGDDLADRVVRRVVFTEPVFCQGREPVRINLGLMQKGHQRTVVGNLSTGLDALKVICCITMDG